MATPALSEPAWTAWTRAAAITVVPRASTDAISAVWVPLTVTLGNLISPPLSPSLASKRKTTRLVLEPGAVTPIFMPLRSFGDL